MSAPLQPMPVTNGRRRTWMRSPRRRPRPTRSSTAAKTAANEVFDGGENGDCQAKYMRCLATAFKTGAEHVGEPGGITE